MLTEQRNSEKLSTYHQTCRSTNKKACFVHKLCSYVVFIKYPSNPVFLPFMSKHQEAITTFNSQPLYFSTQTYRNIIFACSFQNTNKQYPVPFTFPFQTRKGQGPFFEFLSLYPRDQIQHEA